MSRMVRDYLSKGEKVVKEFGISKIYVRYKIQLGILGIIIGILLFFISGLLGMIIFLVSLGVLFYGIYIKHYIKYILTNKRIISIHGLFNVFYKSVHYPKITDLVVKDSKMMSFVHFSKSSMGFVYINTAGGPHHEMVLGILDNPYEIKKLIESKLAGRRK